MPVTLAQTKLLTQDDVDGQIIDEFRKSSVILDLLPFHNTVNPMGGGTTLTYGYTRQVTQRGAAFRAINSEYTPAEATKQRYTVDLKPLGGSFQIDRVLAGIARGEEVSFQLRELIKGTRTKFADEVINGDVAVDVNGFDGLDKALTGSSTEIGADEVTDWSDLNAAGATQTALDRIDDFLGYLDGAPTILLGNHLALAKLRSLARRANMDTVAPTSGLLNSFGQPLQRQAFGGIVIADPGDKAGSSTPIIPVEDRTVDGTPETGLTDIYAVRIGMDGFHGVSTSGALVRTWLPDFTTAGAVKTGEAEMGPVSVALKATKAAAVLRNVKVR